MNQEGKERVHLHVGQFLGLVGRGRLAAPRASIRIADQTILVGWWPRCGAAPQAAVPQDLLDHLALRWFYERDDLHPSATTRRTDPW